MTDTSGQGRDSRPASVGASLMAADVAARDLLIDVRSTDAPAMVRSWGELVATAAALWVVLPGGSESQTMTRLAEMARGLDRAHTQLGWPRLGAPDDRLVQMSRSLAKVTEQITAADAPVAGAATDVARTRLLHTLYVVAHATGVAVRDNVREADRRTRGTAVNGELARAAPAILARLEAFEQIAGSDLGIGSGLVRSGAPTTSGVHLREALIQWDILAHRALAATPTVGTLVLIARVHASLAMISHAMLSEATAAGHLDADMFTQRLTPALDRAQRDWSQLARRWSELTSPTTPGPGPGLAAAAGSLRAAMSEVAGHMDEVAGQSVVAARADLGVVGRDLQQALSAAVDIAHIVRDLAARHPGLYGPARVMSRRANDEAELHGPVISGVWVPLRDVHANRLVQIPAPVRAALVVSSDDAIRAATLAMSAAAVLDRPAPPADGGRGVHEHAAAGLGRSPADRSPPAKGSAPAPAPNR